MAGRWAKLYEKTEDWQWYKDGNTARVFFHLLIKTNYKDTTWKGLSVKRGQLVTSLPSIARALGISVQNVRTALDHLVSTGEISQDITNSYRVVTVNNWGIYQGEEGEKTDEVTDHQQANQQANHKQNNRLKHLHRGRNKGIATNKSTGKSTDELTADIEGYRISLSLRLTNEAFSWLGSTMPPLMVSDIEDLIWAGQADEDLVLEAIKIAKGKGKRSWPYAHGVLKGMISDGYTTGQAYRDARAPRTAGNGNKGERGVSASGKYRERVDWGKHMETVEDED